jgi:hypothetical protein
LRRPDVKPAEIRIIRTEKAIPSRTVVMVTDSTSLKATPKKSAWTLGTNFMMSLRTNAMMKMVATALGNGSKKYFMRASRT